MLKLLSLTLLVVGLSALGGCSIIKEVAAIESNLVAAPANCPPVIPNLPDVNENNLVVLHPKDQESLLIYFLEVERCSATVWAS